MEGTYARRTLPCFDEPDFKASFDVEIEHRSDMIALSNGMELSTVELDDHWSRTVFKRVAAMPTFLLAMVIHDFQNISVVNDDGCLVIHIITFKLSILVFTLCCVKRSLVQSWGRRMVYEVFETCNASTTRYQLLLCTVQYSTPSMQVNSERTGACVKRSYFKQPKLFTDQYARKLPDSYAFEKCIICP